MLRGSVVREPNPAHGTRNEVLIFHASTLSRTLRGRAGGPGLTLRLSLDRPRPERARAPACALWRSPAPCAGGRAAQSCLHAYHSTDREPSAHGRQPVRFGALPRLARESAWPGAASAPITRSTQIRARPVDIQATIAPTSGLMRMLRAVCWRCRGCLCAYRSTAPCASTGEGVQPGAASALITRRGLFETLGRTGASPVRFARRSPALCAGERAGRGCPGVNAQRTRPARQKMEIGGMARTKDNVHSAGARPMDIVISPQSRQGCGRAGGFPPGPILVRDYSRKKDRA